jgi:nucleotide-binding universal stress UspA family protein
MYVPNVGELLEGLIAHAERQLAVLKQSASALGLAINTAVVSGRPAHAIVEHAKDGGFDLIVMGTHGRTGLSHAMMGSVAERVVRRAPCPVLTVQMAEAAEAGRASAAA